VTVVVIVAVQHVPQVADRQVEAKSGELMESNIDAMEVSCVCVCVCVCRAAA